MECRKQCGACCIAPSIREPIPGMPQGKPAGVACVHLNEQFQCLLFGQASRPKLCRDFAAELSVCGDSREEALLLLADLETLTQP